MNRTYEEWLKYYENATKEQVIEDMMLDIKEIERLKEMKLHTEKYASEMEDKYIIEKNKNDKAIEELEKYINEHYVIDNPIKFKNDLLDKLKKMKKGSDNNA